MRPFFLLPAAIRLLFMLCSGFALVARSAYHSVTRSGACTAIGTQKGCKLLTQERTDKILGHTPMARFGKSSELVGAAVYLASDKASSFVTGSILRVDGGYGAMTI